MEQERLGQALEAGDELILTHGSLSVAPPCILGGCPTDAAVLGYEGGVGLHLVSIAEYPVNIVGAALTQTFQPLSKGGGILLVVKET